MPTEAGLAFFREAQLTLRHAEQAARAAQQARLSGTVSVGLAPTTASVLGVPLMRAMRERYPDVRLHMVESLSGHLTHMLNARQLDLAVLFDTDAAPALERDAAAGGKAVFHPLAPGPAAPATHRAAPGAAQDCP